MKLRTFTKTALFPLVGCVLASGGIGLSDWRLYVVLFSMALLELLGKHATA